MAKYSNISDARAAFDSDMKSGKATTSDWGSYYHSTAKDSGGSVVTSSNNSYHYSPDGSAYYTDHSGNRTQLSGARGTESYRSGQFNPDGNGGHTNPGYDPAISGLNSAPRELTSAEKAQIDAIVQQAMRQTYGWSASDTYNKDLQYALQGTNMTPAEYRQDMLNRVGTIRADGRYVTQADVDKELERLGLGANSIYATEQWYTAQNGNGNNNMLLPQQGSAFNYPNGGAISSQMYNGNALNQFNSGNSLAMDYYRQAMAQAEAAQKARLEALMGQIDAQRPGINSQADEYARQAYINQRLGQQAARENLAASGLANTGVSETTNLGIQTAYQQALDQINQNKQTALQNLDNAKVQAQTTGNADLASIQSQYASGLADMQTQYEQEMYNRWLTGQQMAIQQEQNQWEREWAMQQYNNQLRLAQINAQSDQQAAEYERLYKLLSAGVLTPEVLQYAGLNSKDEYYDMLRQIELAQYIPKTTSKAKSSGGGNYNFDDSDLSYYNTSALPQTGAAPFAFNFNQNGANQQSILPWQYGQPLSLGSSFTDALLDSYYR